MSFQKKKKESKYIYDCTIIATVFTKCLKINKNSHGIKYLSQELCKGSQNIKSLTL